MLSLSLQQKSLKIADIREHGTVLGICPDWRLSPEALDSSVFSARFLQLSGVSYPGGPDALLLQSSGVT